MCNQQNVHLVLHLNCRISCILVNLFPLELEKKKEAKQREKEAKEREAQKKKKAEEKERKRKEYQAQMAALAAQDRKSVV